MPKARSALANALSSPRTYWSIVFSGNENPARVGGLFRHTNSDWADCQIVSGQLQGTQTGTNNYDDSYLVFTPNVGADYQIDAIVGIGTRDTSGDSHEVELHLRVTDGVNTMTLWECLWGYAGSSWYHQIAKWPGPLGTSGGDFEVIASDGGSFSGGMVNNDLLTARIVGNQIRTFQNGSPLITVSDSRLASGQPGCGFFRRTNGTNAELGLKSYAVTKL